MVIEASEKFVVLAASCVKWTTFCLKSDRICLKQTKGVIFSAKIQCKL